MYTIAEDGTRLTVSIPHRLTPPADVDAVDAAAVVVEGAAAASRNGRATAAAFTICRAADCTR